MIKRLYIFNIRRRTIEIIFLPGGAWLHLQIATFNETEAHRGKTYRGTSETPVPNKRARWYFK